ncbi:MAG TPA: hypothetical protein VEG44_00310 [Candidatus Acidoferrales bacterium]|nr:hypothetical protein [Candidatus Acidoferrales bacterium]
MVDINNKDLEQDSTTTPFSTFFWAASHDDWGTATACFADDIEWDMMSNNQICKGKKEVIQWLKASKYTSQKEPVVISNRADEEWGAWEYWNIGTLTEDAVEFAKQSNGPSQLTRAPLLVRNTKCLCASYITSMQRARLTWSGSTLTLEASWLSSSE